MLRLWDARLFHALNGLAGRHADLDHVVHVMCDDLFLRGAPLLFMFWLLWFSAARTDSRPRLIVGLAAVCVVTLASVTIQAHLHVHVRPLFDASLAPRVDEETHLADWLAIGHLNSFPSDTAVMYCGIAMMVSVVRPAFAWFALPWALLVIGVPRVYFGYHHASDIVAGALMGIGGVALADAFEAPRRWVAAALAKARDHEPMLNTLLCLLVYDMTNLFKGARYLLHGMHAVVKML